MDALGCLFFYFPLRVGRPQCPQGLTLCLSSQVIRGDLIVEQAGEAPFKRLAHLRCVTGSILVQDCWALSRLSLPALRAVGGSLLVGFGNDALEEVCVSPSLAGRGAPSTESPVAVLTYLGPLDTVPTAASSQT